MNISYHTWKDYQNCPKKYFLKHRKHLEPPVPQNEFYALYGRLTEKFFQFFCNTWRYTMPYMPPDEIKYKLNVLWEDILKISYVNWTAGFIKDTKEDIFAQSFSDIPNLLRNFNGAFPTSSYASSVDEIMKS